MRPIAQLLALVFVAGAAQAEPLTKEQLLDLIAKGVDPALVLTLVERDCVTFTVDAAALVELSSSIPPEILKAAMACRDRLTAVAAPDPTAPADSVQAALTLREVKTVTVIPFTLDGLVDSGLSSKFAEELHQRKPALKMRDSLSLQLHAEAAQSFDSRTPLLSLLKAARAVGLDAFFLGSGSSYNVGGYPGVRLEVKLVETRRGEVVWSAGGASKGGGLSQQHAKGMACRSALRQLP